MDSARLAEMAATRLQNVPDRNVYDNRVNWEGLPDAGLSFDTSPEERAEYFGRKFEFLGRYANDLVSRRVTTTTELAEEIWLGQAAKEIVAYRLRCIQLGVEATELNWYCPEVQSFSRFRAAVDDAFSSYSQVEIEALLGVTIPIDLPQEAQFRAGPPASALMCGNGAERPGRCVSGLVSQVAYGIQTHRLRNEQQILETVVSMLQESYGQRIVDFLRNAPIGSGPMVLDFAASAGSRARVDLSTMERAYGWADGMCGSAFLLSPDRMPTWISTEKLDDDPRQGPSHALWWDKHAYGPVQAFAVVPVFFGDDLYGVLRFIDPTVNADGVWWPVDVRWELIEIATWLGAFLPIAFAGLRQPWEHGALSVLVDHLVWLEAHNDPYAASLPDPLFLARLLTDGTRICSARNESDFLACDVALTDRRGSRVLRNHFNGTFDGVPSNLTAGLLVESLPIMPRFVRGSALYVCEAERQKPEDRSLRYSSIVATGSLSSKQVVSSFNSVQGVWFASIVGSEGVVHLSHRSAWYADYYVEEKSGSWRLRSRPEVSASLRTLLPGVPDYAVVEDLVFNFLIPYSYRGHGTTVIFGDDVPSENVVRSGFRVGKRLASLAFDEFSAIASLDGGLHVDRQGVVERAGVYLSNESSQRGADEVGEEASPKEGDGTRHKAARAVLTKLDEGLIFIVSSNRRLTILGAHSKGESVF